MRKGPLQSSEEEDNGGDEDDLEHSGTTSPAPLTALSQKQQSIRQAPIIVNMD